MRRAVPVAVLAAGSPTRGCTHVTFSTQEIYAHRLLISPTHASWVGMAARPIARPLTVTAASALAAALIRAQQAGGSGDGGARRASRADGRLRSLHCSPQIVISNGFHFAIVPSSPRAL